MVVALNHSDKLQMLIVALKQIAVFNKTINLVTFQLTTEKKFMLTKKKFAQILNIPNDEPFNEVSNERVLHMFNEMGEWNFL